MVNEEHFTKWLILSIAKFAQTTFGNDKFIMSGFEDAKNEEVEKYTLRFLGPDIIEHDKDNITMCIVLNCLVATSVTPQTSERHFIRIGKAQKLLRSCIPIYKYGSDNIIDTKARIGQLQLMSNVECANFGRFDPVSSVEKSTVEAAYKVVF